MHSSITAGAVRLGAFTRLAAVVAIGAAAVGCSNDDNTTTTAASIAVTGGNNQTGTVGSAAGTALVVQVKDQNGNAKSGVMVTFTTTGGATLSQSTVTTDASGNASTVVTFGNTSGAQTVTATAAGVSTPAMFTLTANAGAATSVQVVSGNNQTGTAGLALTSLLVVKVVDQYGNVVPGATIDWTTTGGSFAGSAQAVTAADGTASAALMLPALPGTTTATATIHGTANATTFTATGA